MTLHIIANWGMGPGWMTNDDSLRNDGLRTGMFQKKSMRNVLSLQTALWLCASAMIHLILLPILALTLT